MSEFKFYKSTTPKKRVMMLSKDNKKIKVFESLTDAARYHLGSKTNIKQAAIGNKETAYGYKWEFIDD